MNTETQQPHELDKFQTWWGYHGQYCRAGGGEYEESFAWAAWQAAQAAQAAEIEALRTALQEMLDVVHQGRLVPLDNSSTGLIQAAVDAGELALDPVYVGPAVIPSPAADGAALQRDKERLDALQENSWDLRSFDQPTGADDSEIGWRVIEHHMAEPHEREIGISYRDNPREAIDSAMQNKEGS